MVYAGKTKISVCHHYMNIFTNNKSCQCQTLLWMTSNTSITGPTHQFPTVPTSFMQNFWCCYVLHKNGSFLWDQLRHSEMNLDNLSPESQPMFSPSKAKIGNQGMGKLTGTVSHSSACCPFFILHWCGGREQADLEACRMLASQMEKWLLLKIFSKMWNVSRIRTLAGSMRLYNLK